MSFLALVMFLGITAGILLCASSFPYKKQSFLLGVSGAVGGGVVALVSGSGLSVEVARTMLLLLMLESFLVFCLQRTWRLL